MARFGLTSDEAIAAKEASMSAPTKPYDCDVCDGTPAMHEQHTKIIYECWTCSFRRGRGIPIARLKVAGHRAAGHDVREVL
jgi:hypothetical protein